MIPQPVRITHPVVSGIGVTCTLLFSCFAVFAWIGRQGDVSPVFLLFAVLGLYVWMSAGETEMNALGVRHRSYLGSYAIRWDEITSAEFDPEGQGILFRGEQKKLAIYGPAAWHREQREAGLLYLQEQIEQHGIPVRDNTWAAYHWSKNTREPF